MARREKFVKRTFTLDLLLYSALDAVRYAPVLAKSLVCPATSPALREQVMLGVTAVNDCRYCSWVHTGLALEHGIDLEALQQLLDEGTPGQADTREAVAILYGKHFADTVRAPSAEAERALTSAWNAEERSEIMAFIHAIYFANLSGNSTDAWLARLRGIPIEDGHPVAEAIAALLAAPFLATARLWSRYSRPEHMASL